MGVPRIVRRLEAAKKDATRASTKVSSGIEKKPKKKRADKLRAAAGAFSALAQEHRQDGAGPLTGLETKFEVHERIGQGKRDVEVFRCTERASGRQFAVKRVPKELLGRTHSNEQPVMAALRGSSALVSVHEVLESVNTVDYIMELASGGDLFEWVSKNGALCEQRAKGIFTGLIQGLQQVHAAGLLHRDVKLENILLMNSEPCAPEHVRLADFEFCTPPPAQGEVGSIAYAAPETLTGGLYGESVDVWAAGVALYAMLSAAAPFDVPESFEETADRIRNARPELPFSEPIWQRVSPAAKSLIQSLLHPDPALRLTLDKVLAHPWLSGPEDSANESASTSHTRLPSRPKFALRCTWHTKTKRWGTGLEGPSQEGPAPMLLDDASSPLVACPVEWGPQHNDETRKRAMSL
jgi:serine/threonine protein kinase